MGLGTVMLVVWHLGLPWPQGQWEHSSTVASGSFWPLKLRVAKHKLLECHHAAQVLGEADGLDAFPAWYPRSSVAHFRHGRLNDMRRNMICLAFAFLKGKEVHKLCAEVLARAALLDRNPLVCLICVSVVLQYTVQSPAVVDAVIEARQELKLAEEKGSKAFGSTAKGGDCSRVRNQQWHTMPTMPTMPFAQAFSCSPVLGSDFGEQICCFKFKLRFLDGMTSHANIGTEGL